MKGKGAEPVFCRLAPCIKTQTEVVRTRHRIIWIGRDCPTGKQYKEGDEEADRGNDGKTTSKSGLALNRTAYSGKQNRLE